MTAYNKFKGLLVERGIRQAEIAELLGMKRERFNLIINGQGRDFKVSEVRTICEHLDISPEVYFFEQKVSN